MSTFSTSIEFEVDVEYTFTKGMKGSRDRYGVPETPDDDDEIEVTEVNISRLVPTPNGNQWKPFNIIDWLSKEQLEAIEEQCWDDLKGRSDE